MSAIFYQAVVQTVLIFGEETWVLLGEISWKLKGVHMVFLRQIMGQKAKQHRDRIWRSEAVVKVLKEVGTHSLGAYIYKRKATVVEWVALRSIMEVCNKDIYY